MRYAISPSRRIWSDVLLAWWAERDRRELGVTHYCDHSSDSVFFPDEDDGHSDQDNTGRDERHCEAELRLHEMHVNETEDHCECDEEVWLNADKHK